jgi:hypothetical protein
MPNQPITQGLPSEPGVTPPAEMVLRALVQQYPSPYLMRLLQSYE